MRNSLLICLFCVALLFSCSVDTIPGDSFGDYCQDVVDNNESIDKDVWDASISDVRPSGLSILYGRFRDQPFAPWFIDEIRKRSLVEVIGAFDDMTDELMRLEILHIMQYKAKSFNDWFEIATVVQGKYPNAFKHACDSLMCHMRTDDEVCRLMTLYPPGDKKTEKSILMYALTLNNTYEFYHSLWVTMSYRDQDIARELMERMVKTAYHFNHWHDIFLGSELISSGKKYQYQDLAWSKMLRCLLYPSEYALMLDLSRTKKEKDAVMEKLKQRSDFGLSDWAKVYKTLTNKSGYRDVVIHHMTSLGQFSDWTSFFAEGFKGMPESDMDYFLQVLRTKASLQDWMNYYAKHRKEMSIITLIAIEEIRKAH